MGYEADPRHAEIVIEKLELGNAKSVTRFAMDVRALAHLRPRAPDAHTSLLAPCVSQRAQNTTLMSVACVSRATPNVLVRAAEPPTATAINAGITSRMELASPAALPAPTNHPSVGQRLTGLASSMQVANRVTAMMAPAP